MKRVASKARLANALVKKLEAGNGNIKNMRLLLPIEEEALIPVVVTGISFHDFARDGIAVLVCPVGGHGSLSVSATELLDDNEHAKKLYNALGNAAQYLRNHQPKDSDSDKYWREAIIRERANMTEKQRKAFDAEAPRLFRENTDMLKGIKEASSYTLKSVFKLAVGHRFGVADHSPQEY